MKQIKNLRITLLSVLLMMVVSAFAGPKPFEGIITFKITYPDNKFSESQMAMFPKVMTITIKGDKAKSEIQTPMGAQIEITNYSDKSKVALINMMGQKYAIPETSEEIMADMSKEPTPEVQITTETKTIAGYTCKKAIITVNDDGSKTTYEVWFSEDFGAMNPNFDNPLYKDINGVLLEFSMVTPQFTMVFSAISVEKQSISIKEFEVPADYTITTKEELQSKMGGGM
jgi:GLPGLI family protein